MGVKQMIGDALEGELGQPDLLRRVTEGITALARHAGKGVSRRAACLHRSNAGLELESLDQQQALVVERADGERLRPALSVSGRVPLSPGDRIEFTDGNKAVVTVFYEEA